MVVMYLSGRFLLAIRMPFGVELNSTSFFIVFRMMINMAGRKNKRECVPFFMSVHLADALLLAGSDPPKF